VATRLKSRLVFRPGANVSPQRGSGQARQYSGMQVALMHPAPFAKAAVHQIHFPWSEMLSHHA